MGTPEFACPALAQLCSSEHDIQAVITGVDQRCGRGGNTIPTAVCDKAGGLGLRVIRVASLKEAWLAEEVAALAPDLIVVIAFKILPAKLYRIPRFGAVNVHASLLPKYRGPAPINWALINGETETGLTSFFLKKKVDTGDVILQQTIPIYEEDNFDRLHARLSEASGPFLMRTLNLIARGEVQAVPQDNSMATPAPKIAPFDCLIDFGFPAEKVRNFVRGLSTRPGARTYFRGSTVKVLACAVSENSGGGGTPVGAVVEDRGCLIVQCADSAVEVQSLVPKGKKPMDGLAFLNGFRPKPGELFGRLMQGVKEQP